MLIQLVSYDEQDVLMDHAEQKKKETNDLIYNKY
jgi:hypothetical protein